MGLDEHGRPAGTLYPPIQPFASGHLDVGDNHRIWWETAGNPEGKPALFLHGGPGGGYHPDHRRLFDPDHYMIVLFDQRGCGRSLPHAELQANTTQHLVHDIERLREHLGVNRWLVLGGSWGATLALAYAQAHVERVTGLILRGVFTGRQCEVDWLYRHGASSVYPDAWEQFVEMIPQSERDDLVGAYYRRLTGADIALRMAAARAWCAWEAELLTLRPRGRSSGVTTAAEMALARIEAHYFVNASFLKEGQLIANAHRLAGLPGVIVQGRYDMVTPARSSWELAQNWPDADLRIIPAAGHATSEPGILAALVAATDEMRGLR
ncbi:MAG: prolyl aminopeptidase [Beijerinckiaceae bacterium]